MRSLFVFILGAVTGAVTVSAAGVWLFKDYMDEDTLNFWENHGDGVVIDVDPEDRIPEETVTN